MFINIMSKLKFLALRLRFTTMWFLISEENDAWSGEEHVILDHYSTDID